MALKLQIRNRILKGNDLIMSEITINDIPKKSTKTNEEIPDSLRESAVTDVALRRIIEHLFWPKQYAKCYQCKNRIPEYDACNIGYQDCKLLKMCTSFKPMNTQK